MYQYYLFDLDGTLTDPGIGLTNSISYALKKFGIEVKDRTELYPFIGPPLLESFEKYYGFSPEDCKKAVAYFREYFSVTGLYENSIYDQIPELLKTLKSRGKTICLATSKPDEFAIEILKHFDIYQYFDHIAAATMDETRTNKAEVVSYALDLCKPEDLSQVLMVGDRCHDINGANANKIDSAGVLCGYGNHKELEDAHATYIVDKTIDVLSL